MIALLALLTVPGFEAHGNLYEPEAYTVVYPTGDLKQDAMNIRRAVDGGGEVLLKSEDREGNHQHFEREVLDHLKKECTLYMENPDGAMRVLRVGAKALKSFASLESSMHDRTPPQALRDACVNTLQLNPVSVLEGTEGYLASWYGVVSSPPTTSLSSGIDIDSDYRREIAFRTRVHTSGPPIQIYESVGDDLFQGYTTTLDGVFLSAVGDADSDGLQEIIAANFDPEPWVAVVEVWEQPDRFSYPSAKTTEFMTPGSGAAQPPVGIAIDDLDGDHINEIIYSISSHGHLGVHECRGDNIYQEVYLADKPGFNLQTMTITVDLDNDGWKEAIVGGNDYIIMYEAWADDSYRAVWWTESVWNIESLAYAGDSDGDGLKEFLVGSWDVSGAPWEEHCTLYEYDGAGGFDVTWEVSHLYHPFGDYGPIVDAVDFDGDGLRELICACKVDGTYVMEIYKSTGDNEYERVFTSAGTTGEGLGLGHIFGVGDFDGDNKIELVLNEAHGEGQEDIVIAVYETEQSITSNVLRLTAGYKAARLCLDFTLGVPARVPITDSIRWFTALLVPTGPSWQWVPIVYTILPPILPSKDFPLAFPFPQIGWIGVYSALLSDSGIEASAFEVVDTGGAGLEKAFDSKDILGELPSSETILRALRN